MTPAGIHRNRSVNTHMRAQNTMPWKSNKDFNRECTTVHLKQWNGIFSHPGFLILAPWWVPMSHKLDCPMNRFHPELQLSLVWMLSFRHPLASTILSRQVSLGVAPKMEVRVWLVPHFESVTGNTCYLLDEYLGCLKLQLECSFDLLFLHAPPWLEHVLTLL